MPSLNTLQILLNSLDQGLTKADVLFFIHFHHTNDENVIKIESKLLMIHILDEEVNVPLKCLYVIDSQFFKNGDVFGFK